MGGPGFSLCLLYWFTYCLHWTGRAPSISLHSLCESGLIFCWIGLQGIFSSLTDFSVINVFIVCICYSFLDLCWVYSDNSFLFKCTIFLHILVGVLFCLCFTFCKLYFCLAFCLQERVRPLWRRSYLLEWVMDSGTRSCCITITR